MTQCTKLYAMILYYKHCAPSGAQIHFLFLILIRMASYPLPQSAAIAKHSPSG